MSTAPTNPPRPLLPKRTYKPIYLLVETSSYVRSRPPYKVRSISLYSRSVRRPSPGGTSLFTCEMFEVTPSRPHAHDGKTYSVELAYGDFEDELLCVEKWASENEEDRRVLEEFARQCVKSRPEKYAESHSPGAEKLVKWKYDSEGRLVSVRLGLRNRVRYEDEDTAEGGDEDLGEDGFEDEEWWWWDIVKTNVDLDSDDEDSEEEIDRARKGEELKKANERTETGDNSTATGSLRVVQ